MNYTTFLIVEHYPSLPAPPLLLPPEGVDDVVGVGATVGVGVGVIVGAVLPVGDNADGAGLPVEDGVIIGVGVGLPVDVGVGVGVGVGTDAKR